MFQKYRLFNMSTLKSVSRGPKSRYGTKTKSKTSGAFFFLREPKRHGQLQHRCTGLACVNVYIYTYI